MEQQPLWKHQELAISKARSLNSFALFFEQGTGKTRALIEILKAKFPNKRILRTLIICPPIVIENWRQELMRFGNIPEANIKPITGSEWLRLSSTEKPEDAIYITNYHALLMEKLFNRFKDFGFEAIVLDESHKIKTYNSKTTKRAMLLGQKAKYRYCLSGTPVLNTAFDIYPQIKFLDDGKCLGNDFNEFRQTYFHDFNAWMPRHTYWPNWKIKPGSLQVINTLIEPISMRVEKSECLDLPPLIRQRINCELTSEQSTVYKQLEKEFVADLGQSQIVTDLELTKGLRLQQIVSGYCPDEEGNIHGFEGNTRLGYIEEVLGRLTGKHKVLLWACFRENFKQLELLLTKANIKYMLVHGGTKDNGARCAAFESDSSIRVLLGHPRAAGIGVNLTSADYAIFYSRGFSLEDDLQAEARNYRGGSEKHQTIVRIDLVAPGTIDETILEALQNKQSISDAILKKLKDKYNVTTYRKS